MQNIKSQFPIFKNIPDLIYLDNASTTQKPQRVLDALNDFYTKYNANVHRGLYPISEKATDSYEAARKIIAEFINAEPEEIIFTGGTTDGVNSIIDSLLKSNLIKEDSIIGVNEIDHHSVILPLQRIFKNLHFLTEENKNKEFDLIATSLASNVTGEIVEVTKLKTDNSRLPNEEILPTQGGQAKLITIIDAAQAIAHMKIDVKELGVDFMVFSGHKMYGPTGVGILYGKKELLEKMEPFRVGGGMIREVKRDKSTWAPLPEKFEAGTPPIADAIALGEAVKFITELGFDAIMQHEQKLRKYLINKLKEVDGIKIYHPELSEDAVGVLSFSVEGVHPHDLAQYLGDKNICLRAGHHCTQIYHREILEIPASLRVSLAIYNDENDIDKLVNELKEGIQLFKK